MIYRILGGLANDIFFISLSSAYVTPLLLLFNPMYFIKLLKRK